MLRSAFEVIIQSKIQNLYQSMVKYVFFVVVRSLEGSPNLHPSGCSQQPQCRKHGLSVSLANDLASRSAAVSTDKCLGVLPDETENHRHHSDELRK